MKNTWIVGLLVVGIAIPAVGQGSPDEAAVERVIHDLFDGMRAGDTAQIRSVFTADARLGSAGAESVQITPVDGFIAGIGRAVAQGAHLDERVWDFEIQIDGNLAQVWVKYDILINGEFSHCGVDAFHLHRAASGWKIFHLADTRRRGDGCWRYPGGGA